MGIGVTRWVAEPNPELSGADWPQCGRLETHADANAAWMGPGIDRREH
jgi:hypothetical protein